MFSGQSGKVGVKKGNEENEALGIFYHTNLLTLRYDLCKLI